MKMIQLKIPKKVIYNVIKKLIKENLIFSVYPQSDGSYYIETEDTNSIDLLKYSARK